MRNSLKVLSSLAGAVAAVSLSAGAAAAANVDASGNGGRVTGSMTVQADRTVWNLYIDDTVSDGACVYDEVVVDRNNYTDPEFRSRNSCSGPVQHTGDVTYSYTRGASIKIGKDVFGTDPKQTVYYLAES
jgi:hypothetical protein